MRLETTESAPAELIERARAAQRVAVLSGAGMSADSGVATFRGAQSGLWAQFDPQELATRQAWARQPALVNAWYLWRLAMVSAARPNPGHLALADWGRRADVQIVTQNLDDLHERANSTVLAHLHGDLFTWRCDTCEAPGSVVPPAIHDLPPTGRIDPTPCDFCRTGRLRPGVVWFGEPLPSGALADGVRACQSADLLLVVGTSGVVYPAASLPALAKDAGVPVAVIGPNPTALDDDADMVWRVSAATGLPWLVRAINES